MEEAKLNEIRDKINKILEAEDCVLVPTLTIVGNQILQQIQIAPKPKKSTIIKPDNKIKL
jgi:hypothetical protein